MVIPKGSIVEIEGLARGALGEDFTVSLSSQFRTIAHDLTNEVTQWIDTTGAMVRSVTGRGFSTQFKQMTARIWEKTDPASFSLNVDFQRVPLGSGGRRDVSGANLMEMVKKFCAVPLPREGFLGNLEPPGPSPIEGMGLDEFFRRAGRDDEDDDEERIRSRGYVNVVVGSLRFKRLLMKKAAPTFSKFTDDSGFPISCRVVFEFESLWAATKDFVESWGRR